MELHGLSRRWGARALKLQVPTNTLAK